MRRATCPLLVTIAYVLTAAATATALQRVKAAVAASTPSQTSTSNGSPNNSSYAIKSKQQLNSHQMQRTHSTEMQQLRNNTCSIYSSRFRIFKAKSRFRTAVISLIAISRIKYVHLVPFYPILMMHL